VWGSNHLRPLRAYTGFEDRAQHRRKTFRSRARSGSELCTPIVLGAASSEAHGHEPAESMGIQTILEATRVI